MADTNGKKHWLVDFAVRYERATLKSFNAFAAYVRAEKQFGAFDGSFEVVSYYGVGLVTCLEWHARCCK